MGTRGEKKGPYCGLAVRSSSPGKGDGSRLLVSLFSWQDRKHHQKRKGRAGHCRRSHKFAEKRLGKGRGGGGIETMPRRPRDRKKGRRGSKFFCNTASRAAGGKGERGAKCPLAIRSKKETLTELLRRTRARVRKEKRRRRDQRVGGNKRNSGEKDNQ